MLAHLAHLHDPNDGGLDQDLAVLLDVFVGGLLVHLDEESIFYFIKRTSFFFGGRCRFLQFYYVK